MPVKALNEKKLQNKAALLEEFWNKQIDEGKELTPPGRP